MSSTVKAQTVCLIKSKTAALSIRILGSIGSRLKVVYVHSEPVFELLVLPQMLQVSVVETHRHQL